MMVSVKPEKFLLEWFGPWGRELGVPERFYTEDPQVLFRLIEDGKRLLHPVYMSVQPYNARDQPCAIEKLYFDFDCKEDPGKAWKEAIAFAETLKRFYNAEPLLIFSGYKGFHVYCFLDQAMEFKPHQLRFAHTVLKALQQRLLKGLQFSTLDPQPIGDIKRLARVPFSLHEKTGSLCCPVNLERKPIILDGLDAYRTLDADLLEPVVKQLKAEENTKHVQAKPRKGLANGKIRPCIQAAIEKPLEGHGGHLMRLAIAREFLAVGYSVEDVVPLFSTQPDFNPEKTRYYVQHAQKNPAKPFKCSTIRELGFCLPNCKQRR